MESKFKTIIKKLEFIFEPVFGIQFSRMFYSIGLIYLMLNFVFFFLVKKRYTMGQDFQILIDNNNQNLSLSVIFDGCHIFILPVILLMILFIALFFILKGYKRTYFIPYIIKSFIVTVVFSYITLKIIFLSGRFPGSIQFFKDISFGQIFGFMLIYSTPISFTILINYDNKEKFLQHFLNFFACILIANIPLMIYNQFSIASILFLLHSLGIFYFLGTLISFLSILDGIIADMDESIFGKLFYIMIPAVILASFFGVIAYYLYLNICQLFESPKGKIGIEIFIPLEYIYYYLKNIIQYNNIIDFIFSIFSLGAISNVAITLYKKTSACYNQFNPWQVIRSVSGVIAFCYFLSRAFIFPWYYVTFGLAVIIITGYILIGKKLKKFALSAAHVQGRKP